MRDYCWARSGAVAVAYISLCTSGVSWSANAVPDTYRPMLLGAQYTYVLQHQDSLDAPYSGRLSLKPHSDTQPTHTLGAYLGWAPIEWGQLYFDTEKFMGAGVSGATGLGGLTNGDVVREGATNLPRLFTSHVCSCGSWCRWEAR